MSHKGGSAAADEFNTNVNDKDERKRIRKKRIEKRHAKESTVVEEVQDFRQGASKTGAQQVSESLFHLDRRRYAGLQDVTSIRVAVDELESKRRIDDEDLRRDRLGKLQVEALSSAKANAAVEMKWAELLEKDIPQELHNDIKEQMASCHSIIKSKDDLILSFQQQLRAKDEEYVRTLRQEAEDIEELLKRIRREFKELHNEYEKELDAIEVAYLEERERIIADNTAEIDGMFDLRKNKEIYYKEHKQKREEQYQRDIDDLITKGADQYNKLKIELEMNIQTLKQQLEEIRATYQLNTEKLDYNYRVLTELDVEKNAELARYKRRLNKLKDQLTQYISKFTEMESSDSRLNNELTEDYRSFTQKYKDLQAKFRHFEVADTGKYDEVWAMHEEEVKDLLDQLLKADKLISEQQLGWAWKSPDMLALQAVLGRQGTLGAPSTAGGASSNNNNDDGETPANSNTSKAVVMHRVPGARVRAMLRMLTQEAGFLVNPDVQATIDSLPEDEAGIATAETMLRALGVKSEDRLQRLVAYFFQDTPAGHAVVAATGNSTADDAEGAGSSMAMAEVDANNVGEDGQPIPPPLTAAQEREQELLLHNPADDVAELKELIRPEDVIAAVKAYIEDVSVEGPVGKGSSSGPKNEEDARIGQKRLNSMRNYWSQLAQVVSDDAVGVWRQLEKDYGVMREILNKRSQTIAEVDALNARNVELKRLLNQYLGDATVNAALQVPPAQVMKVRNVPVQATRQQGPKMALGATGKLIGGNKKADVLLSQTH